MMEAHPITWALTVLSITGVVLNIRKKRAGFAVWMVTNSAWAAIDFMHGLPAQGALFSVYFLLAVWGFISWSGEGESK